MSVVTAMPSKHVSLWSVREGGRAFPPRDCRRLRAPPRPCRLLVLAGDLERSVGLALASCPSLLHAGMYGVSMVPGLEASC